MEDEAAVREVTREQLESLGYRVLSCADAAEALAACAGRADPLHLLLTDVVMPGMNGRELAERLTQGRPGLRVLYTSGYGEDVIARHGVLEPGVLLLQKPYPLHEARRARSHRARRLKPSTFGRLGVSVALLPRSRPMCRNIRTLFNFEPPATDEEVQAAALQFVRKLSGYNSPSHANAEAFERAVREVTACSRRLVDALSTTAPPRNREEVAAQAKLRAQKRFGRQ